MGAVGRDLTDAAGAALAADALAQAEVAVVVMWAPPRGTVPARQGLMVRCKARVHDSPSRETNAENLCQHLLSAKSGFGNGMACRDLAHTGD